MRDRESWLAATMIEVADTGAAAFDEAAHVRDFAGRLAELLTPAEIAVLMPARPGHPAVTTGSSERAIDLARLEASGMTGPCTECQRAGRAVRQESLAAATTRWPEFAAAARTAGLWIVSSLPMRYNDETIGAVGVLSVRDHPVTATDVNLAQTLLEAATIAIVRQRALRLSLQTTRQLQHALDSRVIIEQAKGAIAARLGCATGQAFDLLRAYSRSNNRRLAEVAGDVVDGQLPAGNLRVTGKATRSAVGHPAPARER
jgi:GAF domain-containing protein